MKLLLQILPAWIIVLGFAYTGNARSGLVITGNLSPFPIQLFSFNASVNQNETVNLNWTTVTEINNNFFTVEKTTDMEHFETVAIVMGAGTSGETQHYNLVDEHPHTGISYYRLKQTDFDGNEHVSQTMPVKLEPNKAELSVFPNPAVDVINVLIAGTEDENLSLYLLDASGKKVYTACGCIKNGQCRLHLEPNLIAGVYTLVVESAHMTEKKRIIVN
ncbi:MAG TPA: T9SS type A sorting domain-containing protein [Flavobacteriales bacterium]|nr:T9SS type A sorting domain-containing protein [Flavobacteriales bacterium]